MALSLIDWWAAATASISNLRPHECESKIAELTRGGLPSQSMPEVSVGGTRDYSVQVDEYDEALAREKFAMAEDYRLIIETAQDIVMRQNRILPSMSLDEARRLLLASETKDSRFECANCKEIFRRTKNQRPRAGRCNACYLWRREHGGKERPIERAVENAGNCA